jgi:hypothetical protein
LTGQEIPYRGLAIQARAAAILVRLGPGERRDLPAVFCEGRDLDRVRVGEDLFEGGALLEDRGDPDPMSFLLGRSIGGQAQCLHVPQKGCRRVTTRERSATCLEVGADQPLSLLLRLLFHQLALFPFRRFGATRSGCLTDRQQPQHTDADGEHTDRGAEGCISGMPLAPSRRLLPQRDRCRVDPTGAGWCGWTRRSPPRFPGHQRGFERWPGGLRASVGEERLGSGSPAGS